MAPEKRLCLRRPLSWPTLSISFVLLALPAWTQTYKILYAFDDQSKLRAGSTIVQDKMGNIYGASWDSPRMCSSGPCGAIYKISPTGKEGALYEFKGRPDGFYPVGIAIDANGTLYGTTLEGGTSTVQYCNYGCGTVFSLTASGKETVLHSFQGSPLLRTFHGPTNDGILPQSGVVVYPGGGVLYGTTPFGGDYGSYGLPGDGTIYQITDHFVTILHNFTEGLDGGLPSAGLLLVGATLYGTAQFGGFGPCVTTFGPGCGTVFKYDANGLTTLYQFQGGADGASPAGTLITDNAGNLYGTTVLGGDLNCNLTFGIPPGCGVVFKVTPSGQEITLYTFTGSTDGTWPSSALAMDAAGNLYGTAYFGGDLKCNSGNYGMGCGTIFKIDLSGNFSVVHTFKGPDGAFPMAIIAGDGKLLGVTNAGGPANRGVVYTLTP